jgi:hypothetical protein
MGEQHDARADTSERCEFQRLVQGHVSDIRALAVFYGRQGCDPEMLGRLLREAAESLREIAHSIPSRRSSARQEDAANVVRIAPAGADPRGSRSA